MGSGADGISDLSVSMIGLTIITIGISNWWREDLPFKGYGEQIASSEPFTGQHIRKAGIWVFLMSEVMVFATFFSSYLRMRTEWCTKWALDEGFKLRFIEQMPLDAGGIWDRATMVTADEIYADLSTHYELTPVDGRGSAPAEEFYINGTQATVGIIGSVTRPFCGACDRLRLTSDGQLRSCLFSNEEVDVRKVLRDESKDKLAKRTEIAARFQKTVISKLPGHGINDPSFIAPLRPMSAIGG